MNNVQLLQREFDYREACYQVIVHKLLAVRDCYSLRAQVDVATRTVRLDGQPIDEPLSDVELATLERAAFERDFAKALLVKAAIESAKEAEATSK